MEGLDKQKFQGKIVNIFLPIIVSICSFHIKNVWMLNQEIQVHPEL